METLHNKDKYVKCKDGQQFQLGNTPISQPWYMWQKRSSIFNNFDDTYAPPNNCIPRSAKIRMNKKRRNSRLMMERIEASSEMTRLRSDDQYLCIRYVILIDWIWIDQWWPVSSTMCTRHSVWTNGWLITWSLWKSWADVRPGALRSRTNRPSLRTKSLRIYCRIWPEI